VGEGIVDSSDLESAVLQLVEGLLSPHGWGQVAHKKTKFSKLIAPEVEARLDYNFTERGPLRMRVTPYVEVFHQGIEAAREFITGRTLYTLNEQLQYLMADKRPVGGWVFDREGDMEKPAGHLVADSLEYAPPFHLQFRTLDDITKGLEGMAKGKRAIARQSLAIAYCLQGNAESALRVLADDVNAVKANPADIAHERLPRYTELFGLQFE
jgi:hypothetical protein